MIDQTRPVLYKAGTIPGCNFAYIHYFETHSNENFKSIHKSTTNSVLKILNLRKKIHVQKMPTSECKGLNSGRRSRTDPKRMVEDKLNRFVGSRKRKAESPEYRSERQVLITHDTRELDCRKSPQPSVSLSSQEILRWVLLSTVSLRIS